MSSHFWMSILCPQQLSTSRWMTAQVGSQGKSWDQSVNFAKACIIISYNPELTDSIGLPTIPNPVRQLIWDSEAAKRKFSNILSVVDYIRAEYRQGQKRPSFIWRAYITWSTSPYKRINHWRGVLRQDRRRDPPTRSAQPISCIRWSRQASKYFTCEEITKNWVDVRENEREQKIKKIVYINTAIK